MSRRPCAHCQRLWSAQTLVTVGAAELCPVCYKQRRRARRLWPCRDCTLETDRTLVCHDKCPRGEQGRGRRPAEKHCAGAQSPGYDPEWACGYSRSDPGDCIDVGDWCTQSKLGQALRSAARVGGVQSVKSRRRRGNSDDGKQKYTTRV